MEEKEIKEPEEKKEVSGGEAPQEAETPPEEQSAEEVKAEASATETPEDEPNGETPPEEPEKQPPNRFAELPQLPEYACGDPPDRQQINRESCQHSQKLRPARHTPAEGPCIHLKYKAE